MLDARVERRAGLAEPLPLGLGGLDVLARRLGLGGEVLRLLGLALALAALLLLIGVMDVVPTAAAGWCCWSRTTTPSGP